MQKLVATFVETVNAFDIEGALALFTVDAVISDISVGDVFVGISGIRDYFEQFFVGYKTNSVPLSSRRLGDFEILIRLDFTGDFGHETGMLKIAVNTEGLIKRIDADLE